eukprot:Awhi_evm1s12046
MLSNDFEEENVCMICYAPGRVKMCHVFKLPNFLSCHHTYCPPCLEEYLGLGTNLFRCAKENCPAECDTVYALPWIKARNKELYQKMSLEIAQGPAVKKSDVAVAKFKYKSNTSTDFFQHSVLTGAKQCPNCLNLVERTAGCDYMSCRCKTSFCYCCGYKINSREYYKYHSGKAARSQHVCEICEADHETKTCFIKTCPICKHVGHAMKDCPQKVKYSPLGQDLPEKSQVEKLKFIGNFVMDDYHNRDLDKELDPFQTPCPEDLDDYSQFFMKSWEPVLLSEFVAA